MTRLKHGLGVLGIVILASLLAGFLYLAWKEKLETTFVSAAVTSMLVFVTAISVFLTLLLLEENRIARKREFEPALSVYLEPVAIGTLDVVVENIGNGPARNVEADLTLRPDDIDWKFRRQNIRPGDKATAFIPSEDITFNTDSSGEFDEIILNATCTDIFGNQVKTSDRYDMDLLESGEHSQYLPYENKLEKEASDISRRLNDIKRALEAMNRRQ